MKRYYYQRGMCVALGYNSLNPVTYESETEEGLQYRKVCMACDAITKGICKNADNCSLLLNAPEIIEGSNWGLLVKKLT